MQNYYQFIVPRLDGEKIDTDFERYMSLVKKGIAGFIVFGGELRRVRRGIRRLQEEAPLPLIIASDLERGLGQQLKGGTPFPPAMALASACKAGRSEEGSSRLPGLLRKAFAAVAEEAGYAGINTILAPVLDINTNPKNPIIAARAFGEDAETVSLFGCEMIKALQRRHIAACGKHFPGHGDTETDSHIGLPTVRRGIRGLSGKELRPFQSAADAGVKMIMLGHLNVPALDSSGTPVSLSARAVAYLRKKMMYEGILITDALNMGGIGRYREEDAAVMALRAGVDIILHPSDADSVVRQLEKKGKTFDGRRLVLFRRWLGRASVFQPPDFEKHERLSKVLTSRAVRLTGDIKPTGRPFLVLLNDEADERGNAFEMGMKERVPGLLTATLQRGARGRKIKIPEDAFVITAVFSDTKAWKGGASGWLYSRIRDLEGRAGLFISFGSPYLLDPVSCAAKVLAYWDAEVAQVAVAELVAGQMKKRNFET